MFTQTGTPTSHDGAEPETNTNTAPKQNIAAAFYFPPDNPNQDGRGVCFNGGIRIVVPGEKTEICTDVYNAPKVEVNGGISMVGAALGLSEMIKNPNLSEIMGVSLISNRFICLAYFWPAQAAGHALGSSNKTSAAHKGKLPTFLFVIILLI